MKKAVRVKSDLVAILYILPFLALYLIFTIWPTIQGVYVSLFKWTLIRKINFVGLANYTKMIEDVQFWKSLWHTTLFTIISTPLLIILGLVLALISNQKSKFKRLYRSVFFMPNILSVSVISFIAIYMLQPYTGFINMLLHSLGIKAEPFWLANPNLSWVSIIGTTLWWTVGFNMILYLAALQEIPYELYEAAEIDGSNRWQNFWYITVPMLKPITKVILLLQVLASYKVFAQVYLITGGGPGTATRPMIQYIYETGFVNNNFGYASAMSFGLFIILVLLSLIQLKLGKERDEI